MQEKFDLTSDDSAENTPGEKVDSWGFYSPLVYAIVITLVIGCCGVAIAVSINTIPGYFLMLFGGLIAWQGFQNSANIDNGVMVDEENTIDHNSRIENMFDKVTPPEQAQNIWLALGGKRFAGFLLITGLSMVAIGFIQVIIVI